MRKDRLADSNLRLTLHKFPVSLKDGEVDRSKLVDSVKSFAPSISTYISSNISIEPIIGKPKDLNSNTIPILLTAPNRETHNRRQESQYQVSNHYTAELYSLINNIRTQAENKYNKDQILVSLSAAGNSLNIKRRHDSNQKWTLVENTQIIPLEELNIDKDPVIFNSFCIKRSPGSPPPLLIQLTNPPSKSSTNVNCLLSIAVCTYSIPTTPLPPPTWDETQQTRSRPSLSRPTLIQLCNLGNVPSIIYTQNTN